MGLPHNKIPPVLKKGRVHILAVTADGYEVKNSGNDGWNVVGVSAGKEDWADYSLPCKLKMTSPGADWRDGVWIGIRYMDEMNLYTIAF